MALRVRAISDTEVETLRQLAHSRTAPARTVERGPRMDPVRYHVLQGKIQALVDTAVRMTIPPGTSPTTMKNRLLRVAAELKFPVTIRRVPGGLLFWRSTDDDIQQANEVAQRLHSAQQPRRTRPRAHRPRGTR
jgi:hypothetical protein